MKSFFVNERSTIMRLVTFIIGLIVGIAAVVLFYKYSQFLAALFVFLNAGAVTVAFIFIHLYHKRVLERVVDYTVEGIKGINADSDFTVKAPVASAEVIGRELSNVINSLSERERNRMEILNIINSASSNMEMDSLLEVLLPKIIEVSRSNWGAFYLNNLHTGKLEIKNSCGFSKSIYREFDVKLGEGFVGEAAAGRKIQIINNIQDDSVYVTQTFLGRIKPKNIMFVPIVNQDNLVGVMMLASLSDYQNEQIGIIEAARHYLGATIGNSATYERASRQASELQFQNKLIQDLNRELEAQMNDSTHFIEEVVDRIKDYAIYSVDRYGVILTWNKGAELIIGYTAKEAVGQTVDVISAGDVTEADDYHLQTEEAAKAAGTYEVAKTCARKDGSKYHAVLSVFARLNKQGETVGHTYVIKDVTELRNAQETLRAERELNKQIFFRATDAVIHLNLDGVVCFANDAAVDMIGGANVIGLPFDLLIKEAEDLREFIDGAGGGGVSKTFTSSISGTRIEVSVIGRHTLVYILLKTV
jgi:PAS domain S-box-containing protein